MILYHTHSLLNTNHRNIPSRSASGSSGKWQSSDYSFDGKFQMAGKFVYMTDAYLHLLLQKTGSLSCRDVVSLRVCVRVAPWGGWWLSIVDETCVIAVQNWSYTSLSHRTIESLRYWANPVIWEVLCLFSWTLKYCVCSAFMITTVGSQNSIRWTNPSMYLCGLWI